MQVFFTCRLAIILLCFRGAAATLTLLVPPSGRTSDVSFSFSPGTYYGLSWSGATTEVTLSLYYHNNTKFSTIADSIEGTSYIWYTPETLSEGSYFIGIEEEEDTETIYDYSANLILVRSAADSSSVSAPTTQSSSAQYSSASGTSPPTAAATSSVTSQTDDSSILSTSAISSTPIPSTQTTSPAPSGSLSQNHSLSTGAKAGIGVGASIGGILLIALLGFYFFQQGRRFAAKSASKPAASTFEKAELGAEAPVSKGERDIEELERRRKASELDGLELFKPAELGDQNREIGDREQITRLEMV